MGCSALLGAAQITPGAALTEPEAPWMAHPPSLS